MVWCGQDDVSLLNILTRRNARKKKNVGQRWLVGWISVEKEKHTGGQQLVRLQLWDEETQEGDLVAFSIPALMFPLSLSADGAGRLTSLSPCDFLLTNQYGLSLSSPPPPLFHSSPLYIYGRITPSFEAAVCKILVHLLAEIE